MLKSIFSEFSIVIIAVATLSQPLKGGGELVVRPVSVTIVSLKYHKLFHCTLSQEMISVTELSSKMVSCRLTILSHPELLTSVFE